MLYIPAGADFSMDTKEHETVIAVHFDIMDADLQFSYNFLFAEKCLKRRKTILETVQIFEYFHENWSIYLRTKWRQNLCICSKLSLL